MSEGQLNWTTAAAGPVTGTVGVPGDKSISHRALMLAALADGVSHIEGFLEGADTRATDRILQQLGVRIEAPSAGRRVVHGMGIEGLRAPAAALDCGNSGTGMRLLAGLLAGQDFASTLTGDDSLRQRPMRRIAEPLRAMGAGIALDDGDRAPIRIQAGRSLSGIDYRPPVASAQVKSALLLAGLRAQGVTTVRELHPTRDCTERMLAAFGWPVDFEPGRARLTGGHRLTARDVSVPGDFSSAAFLLVAATLVPGSELTLTNVGLSPRRTGLLDVLQMMGADIRIAQRGELAGEVSGTLVVRHAPLRGIEVPASVVGDMIDEFPILFVAAAAAHGVSRIRGAAELRVKESDRIATMAAGLRALGVTVTEHPDGVDITGRPPGFGGGVALPSHGDHRIAMALAVAGALAHAPIRITDCANVDTSFPGFSALAQGCGLGLTAD